MARITGPSTLTLRFFAIAAIADACGFALLGNAENICASMAAPCAFSASDIVKLAFRPSPCRRLIAISILLMSSIP